LLLLLLLLLTVVMDNVKQQGDPLCWRQPSCWKGHPTWTNFERDAGQK
jgi:hypothetical protein